MSKERRITDLVGRVVEMKQDNKRYLVMPFELRGDDFENILGKLEGRISSKDLVYTDTVVIMPLEELPEKRIKLDSTCIEGKDFIVRNIRPEDEERVKLLNKSMSEVLDNIKKLYRSLTDLRKLEKQQEELNRKINKLKDTTSVPLNKWKRPANNSYLLELYRNEVEILNAKERLKDKNRPLYTTCLTGKSNATSREILELLKITDKPIYYRYGLSYRGAKANLITREEGINAWLYGINGGFKDMHEYEDKIIINEYSSNDMY